MNKKTYLNLNQIQSLLKFTKPKRT